MEKKILKETVLILFVGGNTIFASNLDNKIDNIIGCNDTEQNGKLRCFNNRTLEDRDRDIEDIKNKLNDILKQLAELTKEKNNNIKDKDKILPNISILDKVVFVGEEENVKDANSDFIPLEENIEI